MIDANVLQAHPEIEGWSILLAYRGSIAHGMYVPDTDPYSIDDKDAIGILVPPLDYYYGLRQFGSRGTQEIKEGVWDIVLYELTKAVRLLAKGNPNVLSLLWLDESDYMRITLAGRLLLDRRDLFVGKHVYHSFVGYARGQLHRMAGGQFHGYMGARRKELVQRFGYDCKNAAHLIRLLRMGVEFLATGQLQVKRPDAAELLAIKLGEWSVLDVQAEAGKLFDRIQAALVSSSLPAQPDFERINQLCVDVAMLATHDFS